MTLAVIDQGVRLEFSFADLMRYHGPGSPGGVAHAYKVLERALPLLAPDGVPERREVAVSTAFGGPGARDAFVTEEFVDLARTEQPTPEQERRLTTLKAEMAGRVMAAPADAVYLAE